MFASRRNAWCNATNWFAPPKSKRRKVRVNALKLCEVQLGGTYGAPTDCSHHYYKHVTPLESKQTTFSGIKSAPEEHRVYRTI